MVSIEEIPNNYTCNAENMSRADFVFTILSDSISKSSTMFQCSIKTWLIFSSLWLPLYFNIRNIYLVSRKVSFINSSFASNKKENETGITDECHINSMTKNNDKSQYDKRTC